ncbi:MAG: patatin-like phospholipase family protein [Chloroflexi bacterium]|nr:patatin-like phospholipase family protein [Chloroflexota bacterium]
MKVGLCLGGGGSKGYAHIGAIRALMETSIKIDMVNGTSIGAVVGGAYALYQNPDKVTELIKQVVGSVNTNYFNIFRHPAESQSFLRNWLANTACDVATTDDIRSSAIKQQLLTRADYVLHLEGMKRFRWGNYRQIPQMIKQARQETDRLLESITLL